MTTKIGERIAGKAFKENANWPTIDGKDIYVKLTRTELAALIDSEQTKAVTPLVEALRATTKRLELLHYAKIITVDDEIKQGQAALALAGQEPEEEAAKDL